MADEEVKFRIGIDPATKQTVFTDIDQIGKLFEKALANTIPVASASITLFGELVEQLKKGGQGAFELDQTFAKVKAQSKEIGDSMDIVYNQILKLKKEGKSWDEITKELGDKFSKLKDDTVEWSTVINSAVQQLGSRLGEVGGAISNMVSGMKQFADAIDKLNSTSGVLALLSALMKVIDALTSMQKISVDLNRTAYDVGASMGNWGDRVGFTDNIMSSLVGKYIMTREEAGKIVTGLAQIGAQTDEIAGLSEVIASRAALWKEMTPEYQIKTMSDYMKNFGLNATQASEQFDKIVVAANTLRSIIPALDVRDFQDRANQLAISTRALGYNLDDAKNTLSSVVALLKDARTEAVDMVRAQEISQRVMETGLTNVSQMAYMIQQFGGEEYAKEGLVGGIGRFIMKPGERTDMQLQYIQQMGGIAAGGAPTSPEQWAGSLRIAMEGGAIGRMSEESIKLLANSLAEQKDSKGIQKTFSEKMKGIEDSAKAEADALRDARLKGSAAAKATHTTMDDISKLLTSWYMGTVGAKMVRETVTGIEEMRFEKGLEGERIRSGDVGVEMMKLATIAKMLTSSGRKIPMGLAGESEVISGLAAKDKLTREEIEAGAILEETGAIKVGKVNYKALLRIEIEKQTKGGAVIKAN